jgi:hypothetical protein
MPKTTAEMIETARKMVSNGATEEDIANVISDWSQEWRLRSNIDWAYEAAEFLHEQLIFGTSAKAVAEGLREFFDSTVTVRGIKNLSKMTVPQTADAVRQIRMLARTKNGEWVH